MVKCGVLFEVRTEFLNIDKSVSFKVLKLAPGRQVSYVSC
jgi:hypothetical protein